MIDENDFTTELREKKPALADFLDTIDRASALNFRPSPVGMMIARQAVTTRSPQAAQEMDKLFAEAT